MSGRSSLKLGTAAAESSRKLALEALGVERARVFFSPPLALSPSLSKRCDLIGISEREVDFRFLSKSQVIEMRYLTQGYCVK